MSCSEVSPLPGVSSEDHVLITKHTVKYTTWCPIFSLCLYRGTHIYIGRHIVQSSIAVIVSVAEWHFSQFVLFLSKHRLSECVLGFIEFSYRRVTFIHEGGSQYFTSRSLSCQTWPVMKSILGKDYKTYLDIFVLYFEAFYHGIFVGTWKITLHLFFCHI